MAVRVVAPVCHRNVEPLLLAVLILRTIEVVRS